jgi:hypothetical protein
VDRCIAGTLLSEVLRARRFLRWRWIVDVAERLELSE